jgi:hypothetical protein
MLGYLVAQEMGKTRSPAQLAKLSCADAKPLIRATIYALKMRSTEAAVSNNTQLHMP